jgi:hypothetical protein
MISFKVSLQLEVENRRVVSTYGADEHLEVGLLKVEAQLGIIFEATFAQSTFRPHS